MTRKHSSREGHGKPERTPTRDFIWDITSGTISTFAAQAITQAANLDPAASAYIKIIVSTTSTLARPAIRHLLDRRDLRRPTDRMGRKHLNADEDDQTDH